MLAIEDGEPGAEHEEAGGKGEEMRRVEQVEHAPRRGEQGKGANAARTLGIGAGEKVLECQAEKQAQAEKQSHARH
jgi:hypothetical protein